MRYIGSKAFTLGRIHHLVSQRIPSGTFCDPFGGIGTVGSYFKQKGYTVWCGDLLTFAHFFQIARVERNTVPAFRRLRKELGLSSPNQVVDLLNHEKLESGWIAQQYAQKRHFFTQTNAVRIDGCWRRIEQWGRIGLLSRQEKAVLLASLINSMDKVANTAATYYAYLKTWYRKAMKPFRFELVPATPGESKCRSFLCEAADLVKTRAFDVLYLDPPYNKRSYSHYYHLPETIARGETPIVHGKAGIPLLFRPASPFNSLEHAHKALAALLSVARCRLLAFHYSDEGLIRPEHVRRILGQFGRVERFIIEARGYTTKRVCRDVKHRLYLVTCG